MSALTDLTDAVGWRVRNAQAWLKNARRGAVASAQEYWSAPGSAEWMQNSHWRDAPITGWAEQWDEIGRVHRGMYDRFARMLESEPPRRILEWGVGGGSNAVQFAPLCERFVAVDVSQESLDETVRQVGRVSTTPVTPVLASIADQTAAVADIGSPVDLFLCFYVLELAATKEHAHEILRVAHDVLTPGGAAILQVKYKRSARRSLPWRPLSDELANHYTVDVVDFWSSLSELDFSVHYVEIVPRTAVDRNYAYFFATRR
jgi:SAM-dependent methyltransferase